MFVWPDEHSAATAALTPVPLPPSLATEEETLGHTSSAGGRISSGSSPGNSDSKSAGNSSSSSAGKSRLPGFLSVMREVPYSYETLAENLMDPAHLPFSHHGIGTLQRDHGGPFREASVAEEVGGWGGWLGKLRFLL